MEQDETMITKNVRYHSEDRVEISAIINSPEKKPISCVILCHGITTDKEGEDGKFSLMAEMLCKEDFEVLRFDFRGHGESGLDPMKMTLTGELLDLEASASYIAKRFNKIAILAASFSAGVAIQFALRNPDFIKTLILWNPVLDYERTFLKSDLPWGRSIFSSEGYRSYKENGYVAIPGSNFKLGSNLIEEFAYLKPFEEIARLRCPVLTVHGTKDTKVPFTVSEKFGKPNELSQFIAVETDHGFGDSFDHVCRLTIEWLNKLFK